MASVLLERHDSIVWLRMNRPEAHNAFSNEMTSAMADRVRDLGCDREARVAILCGNGPSFSTGVDVKELARGAVDIDWFACWHWIFRQLRQLEIPRILPGSAPELLPAIVGSACARRLCLFGEYVDADDALRIGLVDKLVPREALEETARNLAAAVCGFSPTALRECKALLTQAQTLDANGYERAYLDAQQRCLANRDPA